MTVLEVFNLKKAKPNTKLKPDLKSENEIKWILFQVIYLIFEALGIELKCLMRFILTVTSL